MIVKHRRKPKSKSKCDGCCEPCDGVGEFNTGARPQDIEQCDTCHGTCHVPECEERVF